MKKRRYDQNTQAKIRNNKLTVDEARREKVRKKTECAKEKRAKEIFNRTEIPEIDFFRDPAMEGLPYRNDRYDNTRYKPWSEVNRGFLEDPRPIFYKD